jgi:soluble lytic murein transglycosylase
MAYLVRQPATGMRQRTGRELAALAIQRMSPTTRASQLMNWKSSSPACRNPNVNGPGARLACRPPNATMPEALELVRQGGQTTLSDEGYQWKVRAALRAQEWGVVRDTIEAMPPALAAHCPNGSTGWAARTRPVA